MRKDSEKTIKDFSATELNVEEQKNVKGGDDGIVVEEEIIT